MLSGDRSILSLGISQRELEELMHTEEFVGNVAEYCAPISEHGDDVLDGYSCSAGHSFAYISPFGDVYPCGAISHAVRHACASRASAKSGTALRLSQSCAQCACATCTPAPRARIPLTARGARAWRIWKAISAGRRRLTAKGRMRALEFLQRPCCVRRIPSRNLLPGCMLRDWFRSQAFNKSAIAAMNTESAPA